MKSLKSHTEWKKLVDEFSNSGLTIAQYCRENELKSPTFSRWIKKFAPQKDESSKKMIKINTHIQNKPGMEIRFGGIEIKFPGDYSDIKIAKLISAIRAVC